MNEEQREALRALVAEIAELTHAQAPHTTVKTELRYSNVWLTITIEKGTPK